MEIPVLTPNVTLVLMIMAGIMIPLAIIIWLGKGDFLISGYNTASEEEKAKYNKSRLRGITSVLLLITSVYLVLLALFIQWAAVLTISEVVLTFVGVILMNTWAKHG